MAQDLRVSGVHLAGSLNDVKGTKVGLWAKDLHDQMAREPLAQNPRGFSSRTDLSDAGDMRGPGRIVRIANRLRLARMSGGWERRSTQRLGNMVYPICVAQRRSWERARLVRMPSRPEAWPPSPAYRRPASAWRAGAPINGAMESERN